MNNHGTTLNHIELFVGINQTGYKILRWLPANAAQASSDGQTLQAEISEAIIIIAFVGKA